MLRTPLKYIASLCLCLFALPACGVEFRSSFDGTEVFRDLELNGEFVAGRPIVVTLTVSQAYPVPIAVSCAYEDTDLTDDDLRVAFHERASEVFATVLDANPARAPRDYEDVQPQVFEFNFSVSDPGEYFIACFTVASPENGYGQRFTIASS